MTLVRRRKAAQQTVTEPVELVVAPLLSIARSTFLSSYSRMTFR